ncbi:MAG TPA: hypothetical protein VGC31_07595, partial [Paenirhodobacter sp.]
AGLVLGHRAGVIAGADHVLVAGQIYLPSLLDVKIVIARPGCQRSFRIVFPGDIPSGLASGAGTG